VLNVAAEAPLLVPSAKAQLHEAAFFRSAEALLPLLKQGAATGFSAALPQQMRGCRL